MEYAFHRFSCQIVEALTDSGLVAPHEIALQMPKAASVRADLAMPCFNAARTRGVSPTELAERLAQALNLQIASASRPSLIGGVSAEGGFLNVSLDQTRFAGQVLEEVAARGDAYGHDALGVGQTVVIDYSSPNVARRMHVGHIRSTIIGQALANIFRALGYRVVADNHLGDWGTQFGVLIAAIERWGRSSGQGERALAELEERYSRYTNLAAEDPELIEEARRWSLRLEQGDTSAAELRRWIVDLTHQVNQRSYDRLGVRFDSEYGESFYAGMSAGVIEDALTSGVARRSEDGAVVVELDGLPAFLLQRSDGGTLYHTRDLATIKYRVEAEHPAKIVYVVDLRQELSFRQLFAAARAMGYAPPEVELVHIGFGTVFAANGRPLSTRRGNLVYLEALLDEAEQRGREIVERKAAERGEEISPEERDQVAAAVGIGAVVYNDLYQDPKRNLTLDWDRMLSLDGNSAAYLQYTYARCRSLLRRAGSPPERFEPALLDHPAERAVVKQLSLFPGAVRAAGAAYAPNLIADWLYGGARQFAAFYRDCPVLDAGSVELRAARLRLVAAVTAALRGGLALLGIPSPERM